MSWTDWIWFQGIKVILPLVWKILPKESQRDILQELWAWKEVFRFREKTTEYVQIDTLISKLSSK